MTIVQFVWIHYWIHWNVASWMIVFMCFIRFALINGMQYHLRVQCVESKFIRFHQKIDSHFIPISQHTYHGFLRKHHQVSGSGRFQHGSRVRAPLRLFVSQSATIWLERDQHWTVQRWDPHWPGIVRDIRNLRGSPHGLLGVLVFTEWIKQKQNKKHIKNQKKFLKTHHNHQKYAINNHDTKNSHIDLGQ